MKYPLMFVAAATLLAPCARATDFSHNFTVERHALQQIREGRDTFRYATFGDEAFWGDGIGLHLALAGKANGGVGPGVSPKAALAAGLKVDVDALPRQVLRDLARGKVNLDDPAVTLELLKLDAVVGVTGFFDEKGKITSMGIQCALCHSTVDDSFAPGIGHRLDGWANRDLNVGAIIALAPRLQSVANLLGTNVATVRAVLNSWGPGRADAAVADGRQGISSRWQDGFRPDSAGVRPRRRQSAHLDRLGQRAVLERVRRHSRDARPGNLLRSAARRRTRSSRLPRVSVLVT